MKNTNIYIAANAEFFLLIYTENKKCENQHQLPTFLTLNLRKFFVYGSRPTFIGLSELYTSVDAISAAKCDKGP